VPDWIPEDDTNFDLVASIEKMMDKNTGTLRDITVDDSDLPLAASFFNFSLPENGFVSADDKAPFARQMWVVTKALGEWCPACSSYEHMHDVTKIPVDLNPRELPRYIQFFEWGKCPRCGGTKSQFVRSGKLNLYYEIILLLGQRSGKSATTVATTQYLTHCWLKAPRLSKIAAGVKSSTTLTATFVGQRSTDAIALLWAPIKTAIDSSPWFCLAEGTEISLADGTLKSIENVVPGDSVVTFEGTTLVDRVFDNGIQECSNVLLENGQQITGTDTHRVFCIAKDGKSVVEKRIDELREGDLVVVQD
jgi:hypothetical protein